MQTRVPSPSKSSAPSPAGKGEAALSRALGVESAAERRWGPPRHDPRAEADAEAEAKASTALPAPRPFDLSRIRIHADDEADALASDLGARAFTRGRDIYFRQGAWRPGTRAGDRLLAHELAHVAQQERAGTAVVQCYSEADILPELERPVAAEDTKAQRERIQRLTTILSDLPMWEAARVLARLTARKPGDKLAAAFHHRLSTRSRERLLAILQRRAVSLPLAEVARPQDDPKFVDNVVDEVRCYLIIADRYTLIWTGGKKTVFNDEIDWTRKSHALPLLNIYSDQAAAVAAAAEWRKDIRGYDNVVTYYRAPGGVIVPTWISPETAPRTYELIMGVNAQVRHEAKGWADFFRGMRNGMIVGGVLGGVLRVAGMSFGGGGGGGETSAPSGGGRVGGGTVDPVASGRGAGAGGGDVPVGAAKAPAAVPDPAAPATQPTAPAPETAAPAEPAVQAGKAKAPAGEPAAGDPAAAEQTRASGGKAKRGGGGGKTNEAAGRTTEEGQTARAPYRACFVAGTQVLTSAGAVAVEELRVGVELVARPDGGELGAYAVAEAIAGWADSLVDVHVAGATLRCTVNHRFWVAQRGWVRAHELTAGDSLETASGETRAVERIVSFDAREPQATYDVRVPVAESYYVVVAGTAVRVHNGGDDIFNRVLYWIYGKKAGLRPTDVDGLSAWRTESAADVRTFMETRVNLDGRAPNDTPSYFTEEQLRSAGLVAPETPADPAANMTGKLPHHSLRPASAPPYPAELTAEQMELLRGSLAGEGTSPTVVKPKDVKC